MQLADLPDGGVVALMRVEEVLILELAISAYARRNPDSNIAVRALHAVEQANERREHDMDEAAEAARRAGPTA
jgi:hypothetical protein